MVFLAVVFFVVVFFVVVFLAAAVFLVAAVFLAAVFLAAVFLADFSSWAGASAASPSVLGAVFFCQPPRFSSGVKLEQLSLMQ